MSRTRATATFLPRQGGSWTRHLLVCSFSGLLVICTGRQVTAAGETTLVGAWSALRRQVEASGRLPPELVGETLELRGLLDQDPRHRCSRAQIHSLGAALLKQFTTSEPRRTLSEEVVAQTTFEPSWQHTANAARIGPFELRRIKGSWRVSAVYLDTTSFGCEGATD